MGNNRTRIMNGMARLIDDIARARRITHRIEALGAISDAELSRRGVTRSEMVRRAAREIL